MFPSEHKRTRRLVGKFLEVRRLVQPLSWISLSRFFWWRLRCWSNAKETAAATPGKRPTWNLMAPDWKTDASFTNQRCSMIFRFRVGLATRAHARRAGAVNGLVQYNTMALNPPGFRWFCGKCSPRTNSGMLSRLLARSLTTIN